MISFSHWKSGPPWKLKHTLVGSVLWLAPSKGPALRLANKHLHSAWGGILKLITWVAALKFLPYILILLHIFWIKGNLKITLFQYMFFPFHCQTITAVETLWTDITTITNFPNWISLTVFIGRILILADCIWPDLMLIYLLFTDIWSHTKQMAHFAEWLLII